MTPRARYKAFAGGVSFLACLRLCDSEGRRHHDKTRRDVWATRVCATHLSVGARILAGSSRLGTVNGNADGQQLLMQQQFSCADGGFRVE